MYGGAGSYMGGAGMYGGAGGYGSGGMYGGGYGSGGMYGGGYGSGGMYGGAGSYMGGAGMYGGIGRGGPQQYGGHSAVGSSAVVPAQQQQQQQLSSPAIAEGSGRRGSAADGAPQARRRRAEQERAALERQRTTFVVGAGLELLMHMAQLLLHSIRSLHDLVSVGVGSYYAVQGIRAVLPLLRGTPGAGNSSGSAIDHNWDQAVSGGLQAPRSGGGMSAAACAPPAVAAAGASAGPSPAAPGAIASLCSSKKVRVAVLFAALYLLGEVLVSRVLRHRQHRQEQALMRAAELAVDEGSCTEEALSEELLEDEDDGTPSSIGDRVEELESDAATGQRAQSLGAGAVAGGSSGGGGECAQQNVFVALYDYEAQHTGQLSFKAGDQLRIDAFDPSGWCVAAPTHVAQQGRIRRSNMSSYDDEEIDEEQQQQLEPPAMAVTPGLVPGNFFQALPLAQKF